VTRVRDIGEFALIDRLARLTTPSPLVIEGIGDDCAVLRMGDRIMLASTDMFVEGVHFVSGHAAPGQIGWKAASAAISDIAAMGGRPLFGLVSAAIPTDLDAAFIEACFRGVCEAFSAQGAVVAGGDTTRSPGGLTLDIVVLGEAVEGRYCTRAGARPGDVVAVTGWPGVSAAGLHAIQKNIEAPACVARHYHPMPRVREGQWLSLREGLHALIDVSDGLVQDVGHLARAARLGAHIERVKLPIAPDLADFAAAQGLSPHSFVLSGGEDYELAMALEPACADGVVEAFAREFDAPLTVVGEFTGDYEGVRVDGEPVDAGGYDHFAG
jgi:thiamine-monophosphate kinase